MRKAWSVILIVVFGVLLCGAICIGVGYITGADLARITAVLEHSSLYGYVQTLLQYWNEALAQASQLISF